MTHNGNVRKRLVDLGAELHRLREDLRILDEQVVYLTTVAEEAETRAVVAGTPLADRERRAAAEDLRRAQRQRDEVAAAERALVAEQDGLLERLLT